MRRSLLCLITSACTSLDTDQEWTLTPPDLESLERTEVLELGEARLDPDGPPLFHDERSPFRSMVALEELIVVDSGSDIGVYVELDKIDLLVYLDRFDLASRVVAPIRSSTVHIDAGQAVDVLDQDTATILLEVGDRAIWAEVWVSPEAVDQVWLPSSSQEPLENTGDVWLRGSTVILNQPDGEAFAWVDSFYEDGEDGDQIFWLNAWSVGDPEEDTQEVLIERSGFSIRGFVSRSDLSTHPNGGRGFGSSSSSGCRIHYSSSDPEEITIPENTDLFLAPGGPWIGRTHAPIYRELKPDMDSTWESLEVSTPWGIATVWVLSAQEE